ncbi:MAG: hypothetical protein MUE95_09450 [Cyclobacteriaceae bacterium]|jgi:phosphoribosylanthranilate isomerase|nr:hypothetical protein [Cyclobacteriaceae bacterium]
MALKSTVKVGRITNLSDARYCAGMGVDMLGFRVAQSDPAYLSPEAFQEIRGWFTGPLVVAECEGIADADTLVAVEKNYQPDLLEVGLAELPLLASTSLPFILRLNTTDAFQEITGLMLPLKDRLRYIVIPVSARVKCKELEKSYAILLNIQEVSDVPNEAAQHVGIALDGTAEDRPGLKNYDVLADVFELLEAEE